MRAFALLALCTGPPFVSSSSGGDVIVTTPLGSYRGMQSNSGTESFIGIKYANVPTRFKPSLRVNRMHSGIQNATKPGSSCVQVGEGAEECLFMNIWRPILSKDQVTTLLPVMFWVHGGGFVTGSGYGGLTDGTKMVSQQDVILVSINYRLGPLGFMVTGPGGSGGLNGIMDIVTALQFLHRDNFIQSFGGDPGKITVFGESAGGCATCLLSVLPAAKGLLRASIVESGPCVGPWGPQSQTKGTEDTRALAAHTGVTGADIVEQLRDRNRIPSQNLSAWSPTTMTGGWYQDAALLPAPVESYFSGPRGSINVEAMVIGGTSYDATAWLYPFAPHHDTAEAYQVATDLLWSPLPLSAHPNTDYRNDAYSTSTGKQCSLPNASIARVLYPLRNQAAPPARTMGAFAQQVSDYTVTCPNLHLASVAAEENEHVRPEGSISVWFYQFSHYHRNCDLAYIFSKEGPAPQVPVEPPSSSSNPQWASHASELPFVFGNTEFLLTSSSGPTITCPFDAAEQGLSNAIMTRWANFASTLDPNKNARSGRKLNTPSGGGGTSFGSLPEWHRFQTSGSISSGLRDTSSTAPVPPGLELVMLLSLPESKMVPASDLSYGTNQPNGNQKTQCGSWLSVCEN